MIFEHEVIIVGVTIYYRKNRLMAVFPFNSFDYYINGDEPTEKVALLSLIAESVITYAPELYDSPTESVCGATGITIIIQTISAGLSDGNQFQQPTPVV